MIKAKNPDQSRITYNGSAYVIYDAFPTSAGANSAAKHMRTKSGRVHTNNYTKAIVVDLSKDAGRLRYALFTAKGRKI